jgi:hypothetical protein
MNKTKIHIHWKEYIGKSFHIYENNHCGAIKQNKNKQECKTSKYHNFLNILNIFNPFKYTDSSHKISNHQLHNQWVWILLSTTNNIHYPTMALIFPTMGAQSSRAFLSILWDTWTWPSSTRGFSQILLLVREESRNFLEPNYILWIYVEYCKKLLIQSFCIDFQDHVFYLFPNMMLTNTKGTRLTTTKNPIIFHLIYNTLVLFNHIWSSRFPPLKQDPKSRKASKQNKRTKWDNPEHLSSW